MQGIEAGYPTLPHPFCTGKLIQHSTSSQRSTQLWRPRASAALPPPPRYSSPEPPLPTPTALRPPPSSGSHLSPMEFTVSGAGRRRRCTSPMPKLPRGQSARASQPQLPSQRWRPRRRRRTTRCRRVWKASTPISGKAHSLMPWGSLSSTCGCSELLSRWVSWEIQSLLDPCGFLDANFLQCGS